MNTFSEAAVRRCSSKVLLKTLQYSELKRDSNTGVLFEYFEVFKNSFFIEHLRGLLHFFKSN